jgi:CheY-like chemotaxis protein
MYSGRARLRVRVVDDGTYPRAFRTVAPGDAGAEVIEVATAAARIPDVVLLDVQLPVGDGVAVADEFRDLPRRSSSFPLGTPRSADGGCGLLGWPVCQAMRA